MSEKVFTVKGKDGTVLELRSWGEDCRSGFNHVARISTCCGILRYEEMEKKVHYINRTWERYTYETALLNVLDAYRKENLKALSSLAQSKLGVSRNSPRVKKLVGEALESGNSELIPNSNYTLNRLEMISLLEKQVREF